MRFFQSVIPGMALMCVVIMLLISVSQGYIYFKSGYKRSLYISLFSFFAALFSAEHFIVQSHLVPVRWTLDYITVSTLSVCLSYYFYMKSLSYFLAIPRWLYSLFTKSMLALAFATFMGAIAYLVFDVHLFFHPEKFLETPNFFINSYTLRVGAPAPFINIILCTSGVLTIVAAGLILKIVLRSSRDVFFVTGLILSILSSAIENFLLPFTFLFFVPVIYLSNLFEAYRMHSLSMGEFLRESHQSPIGEEPLVVEEEAEKYQNSNLSEERISALASRVKDVLGRPENFTNPNISGEQLAQKVGIPNYQLSQVINIGLDTTFYELLSQYRIEFVKERLLNPEYGSETIINIAYSAGFNSKSAFNTSFKRLTGVTPSVYRKNQGIEIHT